MMDRMKVEKLRAVRSPKARFFRVIRLDKGIRFSQEDGNGSIKLLYSQLHVDLIGGLIKWTGVK